MKKPVKITLKVLGALCAFGLVAFLVHPLWLGCVVSSVAECVGTDMTKTGLKLDKCAINLYTGHVVMDGFELANPTNCSEKAAASFSHFNVQVAPMSVLSDTIVVKDITIDDLFVSYVFAEPKAMKMNFDVILENALGTEEKTEAGEEKVEEKPAEEKPTEAEAPAEEKPAKKVIIEHFKLSGMKLMLPVTPVAIPLPTIELNDIGKDSGGATFEEVSAMITEAVMKSANAIGEGLKALGNLGLDLGNGALDLGAGALDMGKEGAGQAIEGAGKALDAGVEGAGKALDAGVEGASKALDAGLEGAGKALDSLKSLF